LRPVDFVAGRLHSDLLIPVPRRGQNLLECISQDRVEMLMSFSLAGRLGWAEPQVVLRRKADQRAERPRQANLEFMEDLVRCSRCLTRLRLYREFASRWAW
jgi:hypothetical protein